MSKLYFYDTGLACALLGIQNANQLDINLHRGAIFENFVITELIKNRFNKAKEHNLYFWRDNTGHEIDVIIEMANELYPIEIKSGKTITSSYFNGLDFWLKISNQQRGAVVYGGNSYQKRSNGIEVFPWDGISEL